MKKLIILLILILVVQLSFAQKFYKTSNGAIVLGTQLQTDESLRFRFNSDSTELSLLGNNNNYYYAKNRILTDFEKSDGTAYLSFQEIIDSITAGGSSGAVSISGDVSIDTIKSNTNTVITSPVDCCTGAIQVMEYSRSETNMGDRYFLAGFEEENDGDSVVFAVACPDSDTLIHMTFEISGQSETQFYIYEDSNINGGASASPFNKNRNSLNESIATLLKDPNVTDIGTLIFSQSKGQSGTNRFTSTEGITKRENELILKKNSTTLFVIVSQDDNNVISYDGEWSETKTQ